MVTPILEVTPIVKAESFSQIDSSHEWPPKGWTIYILTLSIDPLSSMHPNLMEYLFDQDMLTFFHPSTIRTSHLSKSSKREGAASLITECRRDSIPDEPASPLMSPILFPSLLKGASLSVVHINIPPIPRTPEMMPPPCLWTPSCLKKKWKPGQGNSNCSSSSS